ncbi:MAG: hypothetical protein GTO24_19340 [candidate division Zixibacteria bacterium]|nr:hypothetical protein [candidate division Zixibacteria bacterium]
MRCKEIESLLPGYHESSLDPKDGEKVQRHLAECADCRLRLQEIRNTLQLLSKDGIPEPEESFWTNFLPRVRSGIESQEKPGFTIFPKPRLVFGLLSAVVVVALSFFLFSADKKKMVEVPTNLSSESILPEYELSAYTDQLAEILSSQDGESLAIEVFLSSSGEEELESTERILEEDYLSQRSLSSILRELSDEELRQIEKSIKALQVRDLL